MVKIREKEAGESITTKTCEEESAEGGHKGQVSSASYLKTPHSNIKSAINGTESKSENIYLTEQAEGETDCYHEVTSAFATASPNETDPVDPCGEEPDLKDLKKSSTIKALNLDARKKQIAQYNHKLLRESREERARRRRQAGMASDGTSSESDESPKKKKRVSFVNIL